MKSGEHIRLGEIKRVSYKPITRVISKTTIPGFGTIPISEGTGRFDKTKLELWTDVMNYTTDATHDGVKAKIRRLRAQEADQLDAIDAELDCLRAKLDCLRAKRQALIKLAWQNGNTVTVKELTEQIK